MTEDMKEIADAALARKGTKPGYLDGATHRNSGSKKESHRDKSVATRRFNSGVAVDALVDAGISQGQAVKMIDTKQGGRFPRAFE